MKTIPTNPITRRLSWLALAFLSLPASAAGVLDIQLSAAHNLVVDSNVTSPSTYAPSAATIGAKVCNIGDANLSNVFAHIGDQANNKPGVYPVVSSNVGSRPSDWTSTHLNDTGDYSLSHEGGSAGTADATRYIGALDAGECRMQYWTISYPQCRNVDEDGDGVFEPQTPPCDTSITGGSSPGDDLTLDYDIWATTSTADVPSDVERGDLTLRSQISAAANKIWPNTDSKVPAEYLAAIEATVGWGTLGPDGQPIDESSNLFPGQRVITTEGVWYDLGNVSKGFDNNDDLMPDQNAWLQPIGDASLFDPSCFRLVRSYGIIVVKLKSGGERLIPFENQLYFENLPDNTGVVGLVYYQFMPIGANCTGSLTPYQESASGFDNEKFSGDYGAGLGVSTGGFGPTDLTFTKDDASTSVTAGATLTYTIDAANTSGVNLGAYDLGAPLVFSEIIPDGTTYVGGSADDAMSTPSGTGTLNQSYTDDAGNLDTCTINYNITHSEFVPLYYDASNPGWSASETGTVGQIQWVLFTDLALDGGHDGTDCIAPDGSYDDGEEKTSLANGKSIQLTFQVTVDSDGGPVVCNDAALTFGGIGSAAETQDCTLITGNNILSGTIFEDEGASGTIFGNGVQEAGEPGVGTGIGVTLYYDVNGSGTLDDDDLEYATTTTDANGHYTFGTPADGDATNDLPDGPYLVVIDKYSGVGTVDNLNPGWGNTTYDPNQDPTAYEQGIAKMSEDLNHVVLAVNIDLSGDDGAAQTISDIDFGFAPPLELTKSVVDNPDADANDIADTDIDEGAETSYLLTLTNRLPSVGVQGATGCEYTVWATSGGTDNNNNKAFTDPGNAYDATTPNRSYAYAITDQGSLEYLYAGGFNHSPRSGAIKKVEGLIFGHFSTTLSDDQLDINASLTGPAPNAAPTTTISTAQIESYVGESQGLDPNDAISVNLSALKPGGSGVIGDWSWSDFGNLTLLVHPDKTGPGDTKTFYLDAIGVRVTTDAECDAAASTTLDPVPLYDHYDATYFDFVSAVPEPTSIDSATGIITWDDVGPVLPGQSVSAKVTLRAKDVAGTISGTCSGTTVACNEASTDGGGEHTFYEDGRQANDDGDQIAVNIVGRGEIDGAIWNDANGDAAKTGENGIPNVSVSLFACIDDDGTVLDIDETKNNGTCAAEGDAWQVIAETTTDANGDYRFIGLYPGFYIVEVGDSDGSPATSGGAPFGASQTAEPEETPQSTSLRSCGTCNNIWGVSSADLEDDNFEKISGEETISGVDFGYQFTDATLYGNIWHDADGDAGGNGAPEPGEYGLEGFAVALYDSGGTLVDQVPTDSRGNYAFSGLGNDTYTIRVTPPTLKSSAWIETWESTGGDTDLNNEFAVTVSAAGFNGPHDFAYTLEPTSSIGDTVYLDVDGDGYQDDQEAGLPDITVHLYQDQDRDGKIDGGVDAIIATTVTDAAGNYLFENLSEGSYIVKVDASDADLPSGVIATGDADTANAVIGDRIWLDYNSDGVEDTGEDGIPDVVIHLYEDDDGDLSTTGDQRIVAATSTTGLNGEYLFTNVNQGYYFVDVDETTLPDLDLALSTSDPRDTLITVTAGTVSYLDADAGYGPTASDYAIGNRVWYDHNGDGAQDAGEVGLGGVDVTVSGGGESYTVTTDASGFWIVTGLATGVPYTITVDTSDMNSWYDPTVDFDNDGAEDSSTTITLGSSDNMSADFGYRYDTDGDVSTSDTGDPAGSIDGTVFLDGDGDETYDAGEAIANVLINLLDESGNLMATTTTDTNGDYLFHGVQIGTYRVQAYTEYGVRFSTIFLNASEALTGLNVVFDGDHAATADGQSSISVDGVNAFRYADFGFHRLTSSIGDQIWNDINGNAEFDPGESGIAGVTVNLYLWHDANGNDTIDSGELTLQESAETLNDDPATTADETGRYLFTNLTAPAADHHYLVETDTTTLPGGFTLTGDPDTDGVPCPDVSDPTVCDDRFTVWAYSDGANFMGADFGYQLTNATGYAAIGDQLWIDMNQNGVFDDTESGIPNITVYIDANNNGALDWTDGDGDGIWDSGEGERWSESDANGNWYITNLADGGYTVRVDTSDDDWPAGLPATAIYEGGGTIDGAITATISGGVNDLSADFAYRFTGNNTLSGGICLDDVDNPTVGLCGDSGDSRYTEENITLYLYRWVDTGDGLVQASEVTSPPLATTVPNAAGNYSFSDVPDGDVIVVIGAPYAHADLTTEAADTAAGTVFATTILGSAENDYGTDNDGDGFTLDNVSGAYQGILEIETINGGNVTDIDFAFHFAHQLDFGDLPTSSDLGGTLPGEYPTSLNNNGARHVSPKINGGWSVFLGDIPPDADRDGQTSPYALGDDVNGVDDEDGVTLVNVDDWKEGETHQLSIKTTGSGWLVGYVDWNQDGDFNDDAEIVINNVPVAGGNHTIPITIPDSAILNGDIFARFRIFKQNPWFSLNAHSGAAIDGEVEDYAWRFEWDYGDAPASYDTDYDGNGVYNGARHHPSADLYIGDTPADVDNDGQPSAGSTGDDASSSADEDPSLLSIALASSDPNPCIKISMPVFNNTGVPAQLVGWIDLNGDGDFMDANERSYPDNWLAADCPTTTEIAAMTFTSGNVPDSSASQTITLTWALPDLSSINTTNLRLRLTTDGQDDNSYFFSDASPQHFGPASDGEVEDHPLELNPTYATLGDIQTYSERGQVVVAWETTGEVGTVGFHLQRLDSETDEYVMVNDGLLPAAMDPAGGYYSVIDGGAVPGGVYTWRLIEVETNGRGNDYGPWTLSVAGERRVSSARKDGFSSQPRGPDAVAANRFARAAAASRAPAARNLPRRNDQFKFRIAEEGLYAIERQTLAELFGFRGRFPANWLENMSVTITRQGRPVPTMVSEDGMRLLFYAPEAHNPYLDHDVYFMQRSGRMSRVGGSTAVRTQGGQARVFRDAVRVEEDLRLQTNLPMPADGDYWYMDNLLALRNATEKSYSFTVSGLVPATRGGSNTLRIDMQGVTSIKGDEDHIVDVYLNKTFLGTMIWNGALAHSETFELGGYDLFDGENTLRLVANVPDTGYSWSSLDGFEVSYLRNTDAQNDNLKLAATHNVQYRLRGFSSEQAAVYDVTNPWAIQRMDGAEAEASGGAWDLIFPAQQGREYLAVGERGLRLLGSGQFEPTLEISLGDRNNAGRFLIIAPESLLDTAGAYAEYRSLTGYQAKAVAVEEIYEAYGHGYPSPESIKTFLRDATAKWRVPPEYVLLAGKGSLDYKDVLGKGGNLIPVPVTDSPFGVYGGDGYYADLQGEDGIGDIVIGRLPVLTQEEFAGYLAKVRAYEAAAPDDWSTRVVLAADASDDAGEFAEDSHKLAAMIGAPYMINEAYNQGNGAIVSGALADAFQNGAAMVNYIGHGSILTLGKSTRYLRDSSIDGMANSPRLPFFNAMTCNVGRFEYPGLISLAEKLVMDPDGGAIAAYAPTGLSINDHAVRINKGIISAIFEKGIKTIGDATLEGQLSYRSSGSTMPYMQQMYTILGDPAIVLK